MKDVNVDYRKLIWINYSTVHEAVILMSIPTRLRYSWMHVVALLFKINECNLFKNGYT